MTNDFILKIHLTNRSATPQILGGGKEGRERTTNCPSGLPLPVAGSSLIKNVLKTE